MSFRDAVSDLSRDERFKATIYAMNSLLIQKGVYRAEEFERMFTEWAGKHRRAKRVGLRAPLSTAQA